VSFADMDWLFPRIADGEAVIVYDCTHPPGEAGIARFADPVLPEGAAPGP
jgi:hypothetical protein